MSRRQKGPTTEELLQKLTSEFEEYKTTTDENIEKYKLENQENIERFNTASVENFEKLNVNIDSVKTEYKKDVEFLEEKNSSHEKTFNEIKECVTSLDEKIQNDMKILDEKIENSQENLKNMIENDRREINDNLSEKNEQVLNVINEAKDVMRKDIENIHEIMKSHQESNTVKISELTKGLSEIHELFHSKMEENFNLLVSRMDNDSKNTESLKDGQDVEMRAIRDEVLAMIARVDDISEKMYDFEQNKKNNLLFYGISNDTRETPDSLVGKIVLIMKTTLAIRRDVPVIKASRVLTGPEVVGSRPVLVTFETFRDKEDVLRKSSLLRGSNIHVTEDMNRKTRESRNELRRFMRTIKRTNPSVNCVLQYDKLVVDNKIFVWNDIQGKVTEQSQDGLLSGGDGGEGAACPCSRPGSVMTESGLHSSLSVRSPPKTPKKNLVRAQSMLNCDEMDVEDSLKEKDDRIRELEEIVSRQAEMMNELKNQMNDSNNGRNNGVDLDSESLES